MFWVATGLSAFASLQVHAQKQWRDTLDLTPVEVRAIRAGEKSPFTQSTVSKQELQKGNLGQDLPYLLNQTPSVVVTSDAGNGVGYSGLRLRGTDLTRINLTVNGVPMNDGESQVALFVDFPDLASSSQSVQIQRGVGTSTNGAAAFGGTINLSTMETAEKAFGEYSGSYGSFNTWKHTVKAGTGLINDHFFVNARLSKLSSDGYIDRSSSDLKSAQLTAGYLFNQKKSSIKFNYFTGTERTGQAWNGVLQDSLATNRTYNSLGQKSDGTFYNNQTDNYQQDHYQLFLNHAFSRRLQFNAALHYTRGKGYYEEYKAGEKYSKYGLPDYIQGGDTITKTDLVRQLWLDNHFYGGIFSFLYTANNLKVTLGSGWNQYLGKHYGDITWAMYNIPDHYRWYSLDAQKNDFNSYVKAEYQLNRFVLFGDLQYRNIAYIINGFRNNPDIRHNINYNFVNPKAGVSYLFDGDQNSNKAYASYAMANKEPNRDDFEAAAGNMPRPEQLQDIEAGFEQKAHRYNWSANLYYMKYKDQLVLTGKINDVGAYTRENIADSYRAGLELAGGMQLHRSLSLFANATFSRNKIKNFTEYTDNYDTNTQDVQRYEETDISFSPNLIASGGITFNPIALVKGASTQHQFEIDILGKYVGRQFLDNTSNEARSINAYGLLDSRFRYRFTGKPFSNIGVTLALYNILDKKYEANGYTFSYVSGGSKTTENYYYPQAGFNWMLGITVGF